MLTELAVPYMVIPGITEFARGGRHDPPSTDDGNCWVDGFCWLYCGKQWTRVLWIGPANVAGVQAPMFACGPCIRELQDRVWQSILLADEPSRPVSAEVPESADQPRSRRGGRHRGRRRLLPGG